MTARRRYDEATLVTGALTLAFCVVLVLALTSWHDPVAVWSSVVMIALNGGLTARALRRLHHAG